MLEYQVIAKFKEYFYRDVITDAHLVPGQVGISKVTYENGAINDNFNFIGYLFKKDGKKYLLSLRDSNGRERDLKDMLPFFVTKSMKVIFRNEVYEWIRGHQVAKLKPTPHITFSEVIDKLCCISHSHKKHQRLYAIISWMSMFDRLNIRLSTPAGFGKDSMVDFWRDMHGGAGTIENPTVAKLEERSVILQWLVVNELVGIKSEQWKDIEIFLLASGGFKSEITKRSKAHGIVGEVIDLTRLSLSLFYNDIDHYPKLDKYMDFTTKKAVLDRFLPIRLYGRVNEQFEGRHDINMENFVRQNEYMYRRLLESIEYYKINMHNIVTDFRPKKVQYPERWMINYKKIEKCIAMDCQTQEEFDERMDEFRLCIDDYHEMLNYRHHIDKYIRFIYPNIVLTEEYTFLPDFLDFLERMKYDVEKIAHVKSVIEAGTFIEKNKLMQYYMGVKGDTQNNFSEFEKWNV